MSRACGTISNAETRGEIHTPGGTSCQNLKDADKKPDTAWKPVREGRTAKKMVNKTTERYTLRQVCRIVSPVLAQVEDEDDEDEAFISSITFGLKKAS